MVSVVDEFFLSHEKVLKKLIDEIVVEYQVPHLKEIVMEIKNLKVWGYYERLYEAVDLWGRILDKDATFSKEENRGYDLKC